MGFGVLETNYTFGHKDEVTGLQGQVAFDFSFVENVSDVDDKRFFIGFSRTAFASDFDVVFVSKIVEATSAEDGFAQREDFIAGNVLRPRHMDRADEIDLAAALGHE